MRALMFGLWGTVLLASLACSMGPSEAELRLAELEAERAVEEAEEAAAAAAEVERREAVRTEVEEIAGRFEGDGGYAERLMRTTDFTESDRQQAIADLDRIGELIEANPDLREFGNDDGEATPSLATAFEGLAKARALFEGTTIGTADVDARTGAQIGITIEPGWAVRLDVLEGEWAAGDNARNWPPNPGTGYASYSPGWADYRRCPSATMGALIGKVGSSCFQAGDWSQIARRGLLELSMNDTSDHDNVGRLRVRYVIIRSQ